MAAGLYESVVVLLLVLVLRGAAVGPTSARALSASLARLAIVVVEAVWVGRVGIVDRLRLCLSSEVAAI